MIYALIDKRSLLNRNIKLLSLLQAIKAIKVPILQYRNKSDDSSEIRADIELIRANFQGKIIINDHIGLIDLVDGVHLGQEDLQQIDNDPQKALKTVRKMIGTKIFGLSTHNENEIRIANTLDVDYIGLGAYRSSGTKNDAEVYGKKLLEIAKISEHPVALIGGVRLDDHFDDGVTCRVIGSDLFNLL